MMFCTVYRWQISRSMDSPGALSPRVEKHVDQCQACREYRDRCVELADRLADEARKQAGRVSDELHARILLRCGAGAEAAAPAAMPRLNRRRLRLAFAAAAAAAAILLALAAWYLYPAVTQTPEEKIVLPDRKPDPALRRIESPDEGVPIDLRWPAIALAAANDALDRSMDDEFKRLRESGLAAADFVLARMPIDIDLP